MQPATDNDNFYYISLINLDMEKCVILHVILEKETLSTSVCD